MANETLRELDADLDIIQKLGDEPNADNNLTAAELKAKFDEAGNILKKYINENVVPDSKGNVPNTRKVNGKPLSSDVSLTAADVSARPNTWIPTAADVGAFALNGSNTMTGDLKIEKSVPMTVFSDPAYPSSVGEVGAYGSSVRLTNKTPGGTFNSLVVSHPESPLAEALRLLWHDEVLYNVFHTGNKPSGYYTGNGSAAARRIETGGFGNLIHIYSEAGSVSAIIGFMGGFGIGTDGTLTPLSYEITWFRDGVLAIATDSRFLNQSGLTYKYDVL